MSDEKLKAFSFFRSYYESARRLKDKDRLSLYDAIVQYAFEDSTPKMTYNAESSFILIEPTLSKSKAKARSGAKGGKSKVQADDEQTDSELQADVKQNGSKREANRKQTPSDISSDKDKGLGDGFRIVDEEVEGDNSPQPPSGGEGKASETAARKAEIAKIWEEYDFSPDVEKAVMAWGKYKAERNQRYKPTGLRSLLSQVRNRVEEYGEQAVIAVIYESMASGYQGITWGNVAKHRSITPGHPQAPNSPSKNPFINAVLKDGGDE